MIYQNVFSHSFIAVIKTQERPLQAAYLSKASSSDYSMNRKVVHTQLNIQFQIFPLAESTITEVSH